MKASRESSRSERRRFGQSTVEYTLLVACFAVPICMYLFFPWDQSRVARAIVNMFRSQIVDMSGPGI